MNSSAPGWVEIGPDERELIGLVLFKQLTTNTIEDSCTRNSDENWDKMAMDFIYPIH